MAFQLDKNSFFRHTDKGPRSPLRAKKEQIAKKMTSDAAKRLKERSSKSNPFWNKVNNK